MKNGSQNVLDVAKIVSENAVLFNDEKTPFKSFVSESGNPRVLVIAGDNASGKSLFMQIMVVIGSDDGLSPITISIRERTGAGTFEMSGLRRTMMFGDESEQSTGATSAKVMQAGFRNVRSRAEDGKKSILYLDEPEMGLSHGYAKAMGKLIARETNLLPKDSPGVVVVTHNRALVEGLISELGEKPAFANMSGAADLEMWLSSPEEKSVDDLLALQKRDHETRLQVYSIIEKSKASRREKKSSDSNVEPNRKRGVK